MKRTKFFSDMRVPCLSQLFFFHRNLGEERCKLGAGKNVHAAEAAWIILQIFPHDKIVELVSTDAMVPLTRQSCK